LLCLLLCLLSFLSLSGGLAHLSCGHTLLASIGLASIGLAGIGALAARRWTLTPPPIHSQLPAASRMIAIGNCCFMFRM
jgi:hypothetical protein